MTIFLKIYSVVDQASPSPVSGRDVADGRHLYKPGTNRMHNAEEALRWSKLTVRDAMVALRDKSHLTSLALW